MDRDKEVLKSLGKWKFLCGRHILFLCGFSSERTLNRRLKLLVDNKLVERSKVLYGVPYIYTLAHKGQVLIGVNKRKDKIRLELIKHDITVLDVLIFLVKEYNIDVNTVISEKDLNRKEGFSNRKHQPDFIFTKDNKVCAVEIELTVKSLERLETNCRLNYLSYDYQYWFIETKTGKIATNLNNLSIKYPNIIINYWGENYVQRTD